MMANGKNGKLESRCAALTLPQRYCIIKDGECNERSRYDCQLWRQHIQPVHQRQHAARLNVLASMMYNESYEREGEPEKI